VVTSSHSRERCLGAQGPRAVGLRRLNRWAIRQIKEPIERLSDAEESGRKAAMYRRVEQPADSKLRQCVSDKASVEELLAFEARYCSYGDTVHYRNTPKVFERCNGSFLYDREGRDFLDLQMWYSAVNFGYRNPRLDAVVRRQLDRLPQVASQYL